MPRSTKTAQKAGLGDPASSPGSVNTNGSTPSSGRINFAQEGIGTAVRLPQIPPLVSDLTIQNSADETRIPMVTTSAQLISSTPAVSPSTAPRNTPKPAQEITDEFYNTTPISQDLGTSLIAAPSPIQPMPKKPSAKQIQNFLDKLEDHIKHFDTKFRGQPGLKSSIQEDSQTLLNHIDDAQTKAIEVNAIQLLAKCSELQCMTNRLTDELLDKVSDQDVHTKDLMYMNPSNQAIGGATAFPQIDIETTALQNNGILTPKHTEAPDCRTLQQLIEGLTTRVEQLEEQNKIQANNTAFKLKSLNDMQVGTSLACKQYEQIASGVILDKVRLRKQFQTLLERFENLQEQVTGVISRTEHEYDSSAPQQLPQTCSSTIPITGIRVLTRNDASVTVQNVPLINTGCIPAVCSLTAATNTQVPIPTHFGNQQFPMTDIRTSTVPNLQVPNLVNDPSIQNAIYRTPAEQHNAHADELDSPSSNISSITNTDHLSREGRRLRTLARNLKRLLRPNIDEDIPRAMLQEIYKSTVITVDSE